jgi:hypothetical protein
MAIDEGGKSEPGEWAVDVVLGVEEVGSMGHGGVGKKSVAAEAGAAAGPAVRCSRSRIRGSTRLRIP